MSGKPILLVMCVNDEYVHDFGPHEMKRPNSSMQFQTGRVQTNGNGFQTVCTNARIGGGSRWVVLSLIPWMVGWRIEMNVEISDLRIETNARPSVAFTLLLALEFIVQCGEI
jgi:hypothetical protein